MIEPPEIIRENEGYGEYEIDKENLTLKRAKGQDKRIVDVTPSQGVPMVCVRG